MTPEGSHAATVHALVDYELFGDPETQPDADEARALLDDVQLLLKEVALGPGEYDLFLTWPPESGARYLLWVTGGSVGLQVQHATSTQPYHYTMGIGLYDLRFEAYQSARLLILDLLLFARNWISQPPLARRRFLFRVTDRASGESPAARSFLDPLDPTDPHTAAEYALARLIQDP